MNRRDAEARSAIVAWVVAIATFLVLVVLFVLGVAAMEDQLRDLRRYIFEIIAGLGIMVLLAAAGYVSFLVARYVAGRVEDRLVGDDEEDDARKREKLQTRQEVQDRARVTALIDHSGDKEKYDDEAEQVAAEAVAEALREFDAKFDNDEEYAARIRKENADWDAAFEVKWAAKVEEAELELNALFSPVLEHDDDDEFDDEFDDEDEDEDESKDE